MLLAAIDQEVLKKKQKLSKSNQETTAQSIYYYNCFAESVVANTLTRILKF